MFIKYMLYLMYAIVGLACYSICFVAIFMAQKKPQQAEPQRK
jgi:uncharacterized membrane protein YuzA (DUF378 family)